MKSTRAQLAVIIVTLVFSAVTVGFFIGRGVSAAPISISVASPSAQNDSPDESGSPASSTPAVQGKLVNINTAGEDELCTLPGIGSSTAQRIIEHRTENGSFKYIEDIMDVYGVGMKTFDSIKDLITTK